MSSMFELEVRLRGPARQVETNYGPREERDEFVRFDFPVTGALGWELVHYIVTEFAKPVLGTSNQEGERQ